MFYHRFFGRFVSMILVLVLIFAGGNLAFRSGWMQGYAASQGQVVAPVPVQVDFQNWIPAVLIIGGILLVLSIGSAITRYYFWKKMGGPEMFAKFRQAGFYGHRPMQPMFHHRRWCCYPYAPEERENASNVHDEK